MSLSANQKRQAVRNAAIAALKAQGKTCEQLTGKGVVSALTNNELRALCAALGVDVSATIATAEANAPAPGSLSAALNASAATQEENWAPDSAEDFDAPGDAPSADALPEMGNTPEDRAKRLPSFNVLAAVLAPQAVDALVQDVAGVYRALDNAMRDAKTAKERAAIARPVLAATAQDAAPGATHSAAALFGVKTPLLEALSLPLWNSPDAPALDPFHVWTPELLEDTAVCLADGSFPWFYGPKGTGKTSTAQQIAATLQRPFFRIAFNGHTEPRELLGGDGLKEGKTYWRDGPLTAALRTPGAVILFDEPSLGRESCHAAIQTILDHGYVVLESGERVDVAPGVIFMAADNTNGRGDESGLYAGARTLNAAYLDRFAVALRVDYPSEKLETAALVNRANCPKDLARLVVKFAAKTRAKCQSGDLVEGLGFRRLVAFTRRIMAGVEPSRAFDTAILNCAHSEDVAALGVLATADLNWEALKIAAGHAKPDAAQNAAPAQSGPTEYKDARNARAASDFDAI